MSWTERLGPLRERNFAWFVASRLTNTFGRTMATVALAFAVLDLTGSATALGQVLAAHTVPMVLFLLFGGVVADRLPRTLVIQFSNVVSGLSQGVVATLLVTGTAELWMLIVLEAVHGLVSALSFPALSSVVPQLVPREELQQANALLSMSRGALTIVGPTAGALLVVTVGSGWALAVDAVAWLLAALLLLPVDLPGPAPREESSTTWTELREGWDLFRGTTWLWAVVLAFGVLNMIHQGAWYTLGPALAQDTIGKQAWGYVLSAESVGLLLMTVVMLRVPMGRPLRLGMIGCAVMGLPIFLLGVEPRLALLLVAAFIAGAGVEVFSMGWNLAMQENIGEEQLSRAYSYDALGSFVAIPLGQLAYGPLGELFGYAEVLTASGVLYVAVSLVTLASRSVRDLPRRPIAPPT
ncbi:MAG TPA: MFS transporter [Marmoricola sp.]|nr:MFS transporter [Marmoricola sp.]